MALYCSYLCGVGAWQHQLLPSQAGLHLASLGHSAAPYGFHGKGTQWEGAKGQEREHREVPSALRWREDVDLPKVTQELMRASNKMQEQRYQPHSPEPSGADPHQQHPAQQSSGTTLGVSH